MACLLCLPGVRTLAYVVPPRALQFPDACPPAAFSERFQVPGLESALSPKLTGTLSLPCGHHYAKDSSIAVLCILTASGTPPGACRRFLPATHAACAVNLTDDRFSYRANLLSFWSTKPSFSAFSSSSQPEVSPFLHLSLISLLSLLQVAGSFVQAVVA